jgi:tetratricopeptide (TPR) repeat protein
MRLVTFILTGLLAGAGARLAHGQSAADHVAAGDRDHAARNAQGALAQYEAALALDSTNSDALIKAAYEAVDLGEFTVSPEQRTSLFRRGEHYARLAVAANPRSAEAHFQLARALGRTALSVGVRDRIKYATEVRDEALAALAIESRHSGALHVMGMWNAEVMRLNTLSRLIAKRFLGGKVFGEASWDNARRYLEQAVAADSARIVHRLDLGEVYADRHETAKAVEQFEWIARAPVVDYNDPNYKKAAERRRGELR